MIGLAKKFRDRIAAEARAAYPKECCGLIEGTGTGEAARITAIHPTRNLSDAPDRFEIDAGEQFELIRKLRGTGRAIIGCYHSHPNARAEPSETDLKNACDEDFLWLIAAIGPKDDATISAYVFRGGAFSPVRLARGGAAKV